MFFSETRVRVYLYGAPTDMRKSFDGLYALVRNTMALDALSGDLFAFVNRSGTQMKVLYFDRGGWCLWAKRLESGRFHAGAGANNYREVDCTELKLIIEGIEPKRYHKRYQQLPKDAR